MRTCLCAGKLIPAMRANLILPFFSIESLSATPGYLHASRSALPLIVTRINTLHPQNTVALEYFAVATNFLNGCSYFHIRLLSDIDPAINLACQSQTA